MAFPYDYVEAADSVLSECKIAAENKLKRKNSRLDKCGIPEDQLYLMQQKLIEKVCEAFFEISRMFRRSMRFMDSRLFERFPYFYISDFIQCRVDRISFKTAFVISYQQTTFV